MTRTQSIRKRLQERASTMDLAQFMNSLSVRESNVIYGGYFGSVKRFWEAFQTATPSGEGEQ